jgi:trehalose 6-phosphate synthase/phosphatase
MTHTPRIINVSNRLPVKIRTTASGIAYEASEGGLATGLKSLFSRHESLWIGWPGAVVPTEEEGSVRAALEERKLAPVFLTEAEVSAYYEGFCNETLWPLFHYFPSYSEFSLQYFHTYQSVNRRFADEIIKIAQAGDIIWVHDYQLMLLPRMLREALPDVTISFFLHIPFPAYPVFMALPWRREILEGLVGADLIGFQTYDDVLHFTDACNRALDVNFVGNEVLIDDRRVEARAFPISIDFESFRSLVGKAETCREELGLLQLLGNRKLAVSVDRLDYSKGILQRLDAYEQFLETHPEWQNRITYVHLIVPSRDQVRNYKELKEEMDRRISSINGKYSTLSWSPIRHFYKSVSPELLVALYKRADIALVTPLRDGMNLVSKEFVACNECDGAIVLSEMAGAARELNDAILINPHDTARFAEAIDMGLSLPLEEKKRRMTRLKDVVRRNTIFTWADNYMNALYELRERRDSPVAHALDELHQERLEVKYCYASKRLLLLDYDGTLVPFQKRPEAARPDSQLIALLSRLADDTKNRLVIISGRDRHTLGDWMADVDAELVAEHGAWTRASGGSWQTRHFPPADWKAQFVPVLEEYTRHVPGAQIEEKSFSIAWHYRRCEPVAGKRYASEVRELLQPMAARAGLQILEGDMVIELRNPAFNKGQATQRILSMEKHDFILAIGDDRTDEDMFNALPTGSVTIKVGTHNTAASYFLSNYRRVRELLEVLATNQNSLNGSGSLSLVC